jgi:chaperone BCS1
VDVKQYIGYATEYQLFGMFKNFYPDAADKMADQFAKSVLALNSKLSAAQVQGYFMLHKNEPLKATENISMFKS